MKNKLEHIDNIFSKVAESDTTGFSAKKGWKVMNTRLLLSELASFNFVNLKGKYLYLSVIILFSLLFSFFNFEDSNELNMVKANRDESINQSEEIIVSSINQTSNSHEPVKSETEETIIPLKPEIDDEPENIENIEVYVNQYKESISLTDLPKTDDINNRKIELLNSRKYNADISIHSEPTIITKQNLHIDKFADNSDHLNLLTQTDFIPYYSLGANIGSEIIIDNAIAEEKVQKPSWNAGLNLRYSTQHLFVETSFGISSYESVFNTAYQYDTLLGTVFIPNSNIVEIINEDGDTLLERHYNTEFLDIYDTLTSNDEVAVVANTTVLHIPVIVGTKVYQNGNFYTSVFTGVTLKLLLKKSQKFPVYGSDYQRIIDYETSSTLNLQPELYFQGGILFGYHVSNHIGLELRSAYSHIIGNSNSSYKNSKSNITANLGINYRF